MGTLAMSNLCYRGLISMIAIFVFGLGLSSVSFGLYSMTHNKLNELRNEQSKLQPAQVAAAEKLKQLECLSRNIYWEAANEPFEGKVAVAQVTMNRLESGKYGATICHVVFQRSMVFEKVVCQFSWTCMAHARVNPTNHRLFKESEEIAKKVYLENFRLPSMTKAMYFHNTSVNPAWKKTKIAQIGQHVFYRD